MWCRRCQITLESPSASSLEADRGKMPLANFSNPPACPHCGSILAEYTETPFQENDQLDSWEERLEEELAEVRELLAESSRLRSSTTRIDKKAESTSEPVKRPSTLEPDPSGHVATTFGRMTRSGQNALPRTPSSILLLLGVGLLSEPWIHGFESIGQNGLSLDWAGHLILAVGGLLWLRDMVRHGQEMSGKMDATIAGLHVLRKDIATPPQPNDAHHQLADLKRRLSAVTRSVKF
ncbi:MAG: hypothetical protein P8M53_11365 [Pirellulales bacterium]|nr:hypothetical protein [Pirellulales bacterium]